MRQRISTERMLAMNRAIIGEKNGFQIRLAAAEDAARYYEQNYCPLDRVILLLKS